MIKDSHLSYLQHPARPLMYFLNKDQVYNDDVLCTSLVLRKGYKNNLQELNYSMIADHENNLLHFRSNISSEEPLKIIVYSADGKYVQVKTYSNAEKDFMMNLQHPEDSFYIVRLISGSRHEQSFKLIW